MEVVTMTNHQKFTATANGLLDQDGQLITGAVFDPSPAPQWFPSLSQSLVSLTPSDDGLSCLISALGPVDPSPITIAVRVYYQGSPFYGNLGVLVTNSAPASVSIIHDAPVNQ